MKNQIQNDNYIVFINIMIFPIFIININKNMIK